MKPKNENKVRFDKDSFIWSIFLSLIYKNLFNINFSLNFTKYMLKFASGRAYKTVIVDQRMDEIYPQNSSLSH